VRGINNDDMKRFEQIIEDTYKRLGLSEEKDDEDESTADNEGQDDDLSTAKQNTDAAEDQAHDAGMDAEQSKQELANLKKNKSTKASTDNRGKAQNLGD